MAVTTGETRFQTSRPSHPTDADIFGAMLEDTQPGAAGDLVLAPDSPQHVRALQFGDADMTAEPDSNKRARMDPGVSRNKTDEDDRINALIYHATGDKLSDKLMKKLKPIIETFETEARKVGNLNREIDKNKDDIEAIKKDQWPPGTRPFRISVEVPELDDPMLVQTIEELNLPKVDLTYRQAKENSTDNTSLI